MRRLLALVVLVASTTLALASPVRAGGPTSVLITDPGSGSATALYSSEPAYGALDRIVTGAKPLDRAPSDLGSRSLNLTWMAHDVSPWRTQQLYPDAADGPVVVTDGATWSRVTEGNALLALVDELMIPHSAAAVAAVTAPDPPAEARVVTETARWSLAGWRWLVLGLLVGAGAVLLVGRARAGARAPQPVLVDRDPNAEVLTR
ncbi:hypothetical protein GON03_00745 [Nocardioides sp. MAH-18]|uniref:Uncharacterized protein n=1 Tax=Nocardioides agri TaxID=2682843 RepID=A0A6L6XK88_9ACTN|nr:MULTISPECIES: hypothetical protein [unclassified Nocardioides]MBA2956544.1 hypothetical protein [Nocardioides sp. CGMCC 1.13656]MVQ47691.1 hypothetical protein [Nocardioides sp. MAH-18]